MALLGAGQLFARVARGFQRGAGVAVGLGLGVLGRLQAVGAGAAVGLGELHFADQRVALLGEGLRRVLEFGAGGLGLGDALFQRGDLAACAFLTLQRGGAVGVERLEAPVGELGFAHDRLLFGTDLGKRRALAADVVADGGKLGFEVGGGRERGQRRFGLGTRAGGFVARRGQARRGPLPAPKRGQRCDWPRARPPRDGRGRRSDHADAHARHCAPLSRSKPPCAGWFRRPP